MQENGIKEYSPTEAGLSDIQERMKDVTYDVTNTLGMAQAKRDRKELVTLRVSLESKRKELKSPALERCRLIDTEAARIKDEIVKLEKPIDEQIKSEEKRLAAIKEEKRIAKEKLDFEIMEKISKLTTMPDRVASDGSEKLQACIDFLTDMEITEEKFLTFTSLAEEARCVALGKITGMHSAKVEAEAEAARVDEERLAKLEEERLEREAENKRLEEERENLRLEQERIAEENRVQQEKFDAQQKILDQQKQEQDEKDRLAHEERERLAAEQAEEKRLKEEKEQKRLQEEAKEAEKKRKAAEKEKRRLEREKKLAEAKCADASTAFGQILVVIENETATDKEKLDQIQIIAEANA